MTGRTCYTRGRAVEYLARDLLRSKGFQVIRSAGSKSPVDLIAWRGGESPVLIQVKRTRSRIDSVVDIAEKYREDIEALRAIELPREGAVHLWVWTDKQAWRFYEVLHGGILEVDA
jgi:Holliday junction resolvase